MVDIHCHLLFNIDDGAKSCNESITIIKDMVSCGYTDIIITPHYISNSSYASPKINNISLLNTLKERLNDEEIKVNLYLGNEIFIDYDVLDLLKEGLVSSLNNSHYILIELPMSGEFEGYLDVFHELMSYGYKVILAHPERYHAFQKDFNKVYEVVRHGVLLQSNLDSIIGGYGSNAKKMMKKILKEHLLSFLATDIHHRKHDYTKWLKAKKRALKYLSEEEFNKLVTDNPMNVIIDSDIT